MAKHIKPSPELIDEVAGYWKRGIKQNAIAAQYGVAPATINRWMRNAGIKRPSPVPGTGPKCSRPDCTKPLKSLGLCGAHYAQVWKHSKKNDYEYTCQSCGNTFHTWQKNKRVCYKGCNNRALRDAVESSDHQAIIAAIRDRATTQGDCWIWPIRKIQKKDTYPPYPRFSYGKGGKIMQFNLHRLALEAKLGRPLGSQQAHHTCANTMCVNPDHLQPVTNAENMAEMRARRVYIARIKELEDALRLVDANHPLLQVIEVA
jgi:hypothetical protein